MLLLILLWHLPWANELDWIEHIKRSCTAETWTYSAVILTVLHIANPWGIHVSPTISEGLSFNKLRQNDAYLRKKARPSLVRIMACRLDGPSHYLSQCRTVVNATLATNFSEILIEIQTFSLKKIRLKMSAKSCPFRLGLNVLKYDFILTHFDKVRHLIHSNTEMGVCFSLSPLCWFASYSPEHV